MSTQPNTNGHQPVEDDTTMRDLLQLMSKHLNAQRGLAEIMVQADIETEQFLNKHLQIIGISMDIIAKTEELIEGLTRQLISEGADEKSIPTPFGTAKLTKSTKLLVDDEEKSIEAIKDWSSEDLVNPALPSVGTMDPWQTYLRETFSLNLEALEKLPDEALAVLGIQREVDQKFSLKLPSSVTPAKIKKRLSQLQKEEK